MGRTRRAAVGVLLLGFGLAGALGAWAWQKTAAWEAEVFAVTPSHATRSTAQEVIAEGRHVAAHVARCTRCHGDDLSGATYRDATGWLALSAPNLTPGEGSVTASRTDDELATILRHGVGPDQRAVLHMPANQTQHLSRDDMRALLSYLRALPPLDRVQPETRIGLAGRLLWALGVVPMQPARGQVDHGRVPPARNQVDEPVQHGRYLSKVAGCTDCHGIYLSGGRMPGTLPGSRVASNLTRDDSGLAAWSRDDFARAVREGVRPDGGRLDPAMPSADFAGLTDMEIDALWAFLATVPVRPAGNR